MLLLSTSSLKGYGLHKIFDFAKKSGYDGLDISVDFSEFDTFDKEYLARLSAESGVKIVSFTMPEKQLTTTQLEFVIHMAEELGVKMVNIHPPHRLEKEKNWFGEHLAALQKKFANILLNVVNAPPKTWLFIIAEYGDARPETIKKMTEHTALSVANIDPNSGMDLMRTFYLLGSTMEFIYLSDKKEGDERLFPGEGLAPLESLLIKLSEIKYKGVFSLNLDPKALGAGDNEMVLQNLERAKNYLAKYFKP